MSNVLENEQGEREKERERACTLLICAKLTRRLLKLMFPKILACASIYIGVDKLSACLEPSYPSASLANHTPAGVTFASRCTLSKVWLQSPPPAGRSWLQAGQCLLPLATAGQGWLQPGQPVSCSFCFLFSPTQVNRPHWY
jgi:hypothetical protein